MFQLTQVADRDAKLVANQQRICMTTRPTLTDYASVSIKLGTHIPHRSLSCHVIGSSIRSSSHMQIRTSPILLVSQVCSYCNPSLLLSNPMFTIDRTSHDHTVDFLLHCLLFQIIHPPYCLCYFTLPWERHESTKSLYRFRLQSLSGCSEAQ